MNINRSNDNQVIIDRHLEKGTHILLNNKLNNNRYKCRKQFRSNLSIQNILERRYPYFSTALIPPKWITETPSWAHQNPIQISCTKWKLFLKLWWALVSTISLYCLLGPLTFQPWPQTFPLKKKETRWKLPKKKERRQLCDVIYFTHNLLLLAFTQHITYYRPTVASEKWKRGKKKSDNHQEGTWVASHEETNKTFWHRRKRKTFSFTNQNETFLSSHRVRVLKDEKRQFIKKKKRIRKRRKAIAWEDMFPSFLVCLKAASARVGKKVRSSTKRFCFFHCHLYSMTPFVTAFARKNINKFYQR